MPINVTPIRPCYVPSHAPRHAPNRAQTTPIQFAFSPRTVTTAPGTRPLAAATANPCTSGTPVKVSDYSSSITHPR